MKGPAAIVAVVLAGCVAPATGDPTGPGSGSDPTDPTCTDNCDGSGSGAPTIPVTTLRDNLLANLLAQMDKPAFLFGQERFNVTGVSDDGTQWLAAPGHVDRSDVKTLVGAHPAVMGFDAWDLAIKPATWTPTGATHAEAAKYVHANGGVVAMEFHMHGCAADTFNSAGNEACLCKLANDDAYARSWLLDGQYKLVADAMVANGLDQIPIVFRPLHEQNGNWFWWGEPNWNCAQYVTSPRFTGAAAYTRVYHTIVSYLRGERGLQNLLIAWSPAATSSIATADGYLDGYPGDAYVDIFGGDFYYQGSPSFATQTQTFAGYLQTLTSLARTHGKVAAATEVGDTTLSADTTSSQWFTGQLLPLLQTSGVSVAYALTWENRTSGSQQFWVPYGQQADVADFEAFVASDATSLLADAPPLDKVPATGYPVCASCASSDSNGDGWGWENNKSCRVASWCVAPAYPVCVSCASDPDGDGWGWENNQSCEVLATCK